VEYDANVWGNADTSVFDRISSSWLAYKPKFNENNEQYNTYIQELKYSHAIETGIIENLYSIDEDRIPGITVTLLKEGINSNFLLHENVKDPEMAQTLIKDQYYAIEGVFQFIKNERSMTTSFIKELHAEVTKNQLTTDAVTPDGQIFQVELIHGDYKKQDNNPINKKNGMLYTYCPPYQVSVEMDNLLDIYNERRMK